MGLTVNNKEMELTKPITEPAYATLALANDFFSWEKEYVEFQGNPKSENMANAVWIIMKEHSVDLEQAKVLCQDKIRESCEEYGRRKREFELQSADKVSIDTLRYLSALEFSISGNVVWSQYSERYHFHKPEKWRQAQNVDDDGAKSDDSGIAMKDSPESTVVDVEDDVPSAFLNFGSSGMTTRSKKTFVSPVLETKLPEMTNQVIKLCSPSVSRIWLNE
jgi:fusicocca-2,10(14)-diene synthase/ophiobolin F synthase